MKTKVLNTSVVTTKVFLCVWSKPGIAGAKEVENGDDDGLVCWLSENHLGHIGGESRGMWVSGFLSNRDFVAGWQPGGPPGSVRAVASMLISPGCCRERSFQPYWYKQQGY